MISKLRIILVPDAIDWILGTWAKEIAKWNSDKFDFVIFPMTETKENPILFKKVLEHCDAVHCLTPWGYGPVKQKIDELKCQHVQMISTIHHIVEFSQVTDCLGAGKIMVVCQKYLNELVEHGVSKNNLVLVYNGVDVDFFSPSDKLVARIGLGVPENAFVVGFSGKASSDHDGRKGIDVFCNVLSKLQGQIDAEVHVVVTGPGWAPLQHDPAFARIVFHHFPFLPDSQMPAFYNTVDVYLVAARVEGGPVPLLEAMSCGRPVVTTPVGTAIDFIEDGRNGLMVPIADVDATVNAVERIYRDANLAARLGANGRVTIVQHLQWKHTVRKMENLYSQLKQTRMRPQDSFPCKELNAELIARDSARWQRGLVQRVAGGGDKSPIVNQVRRIYSKARSLFQGR